MYFSIVLLIIFLWYLFRRWFVHHWLCLNRSLVIFRDFFCEAASFWSGPVTGPTSYKKKMRGMGYSPQVILSSKTSSLAESLKRGSNVWFWYQLHKEQTISGFGINTIVSHRSNSEEHESLVLTPVIRKWRLGKKILCVLLLILVSLV